MINVCSSVGQYHHHTRLQNRRLGASSVAAVMSQRPSDACNVAAVVIAVTAPWHGGFRLAGCRTHLNPFQPAYRSVPRQSKIAKEFLAAQGTFGLLLRALVEPRSVDPNVALAGGDGGSGSFARITAAIVVPANHHVYRGARG